MKASTLALGALALGGYLARCAVKRLALELCADQRLANTLLTVLVTAPLAPRHPRKVARAVHLSAADLLEGRPN